MPWGQDAELAQAWHGVHCELALPPGPGRPARGSGLRSALPLDPRSPLQTPAALMWG